MTTKLREEKCLPLWLMDVCVHVCVLCFLNCMKLILNNGRKEVVFGPGCTDLTSKPASSTSNTERTSNTNAELLGWIRMVFKKINHFIDLLFPSKVCFLEERNERRCETHRGAKGGNEETERETQMKGKSKNKPGRVHWRDKQSIMCGVEEGPGGALLPHFLLGKVILLFMKQKKSKSLQ